MSDFLSLARSIHALISTKSNSITLAQYVLQEGGVRYAPGEVVGLALKSTAEDEDRKVHGKVLAASEKYYLLKFTEDPNQTIILLVAKIYIDQLTE